MKSMVSGWVGVLLLGVFSWMTACGGDDDEKAHDELAQLTPAELCQHKCDLQVAAQCENFPADYGTSCASLCQVKYQKFPSCAAQARELDICASTRVHYSCTAEGSLSTTPVGGCAAPGQACIACTGDVLSCL
jgi:hypothetical protein